MRTINPRHMQYLLSVVDHQIHKQAGVSSWALKRLGGALTTRGQNLANKAMGKYTAAAEDIAKAINTKSVALGQTVNGKGKSVFTKTRKNLPGFDAKGIKQRHSEIQDIMKNHLPPAEGSWYTASGKKLTDYADKVGPYADWAAGGLGGGVGLGLGYRWLSGD